MADHNLQVAPYFNTLSNSYIIFSLQMEDNWKPLESNPEVMTQFVKKLGFNADKYTVADLMSTQEWAQDMIPKPALGLVLLYQITPPQKEFTALQAQTLNEQDQPQNLFYMKQLAHNACGSIALFHVILNSIDQYPDIIASGSEIDKFRQQAKGKTPKQIGQLFKKSKSVKQHHSSAVQKGQSAVVDEVQKHFIAFIEKDGKLYELDGGKKTVVCHGPCTKQELLQKSCAEAQKFMQRDPQNLNFSTVVVCKSQQ